MNLSANTLLYTELMENRLQSPFGSVPDGLASIWFRCNRLPRIHYAGSPSVKETIHFKLSESETSSENWENVLLLESEMKQTSK